MAKCPWCGGKVYAYGSYSFFGHACIKGCYSSKQTYSTKAEALSAASKRFMPKMTVEEILAPREKFSILFTEALNSFPDKKQGECPNVFSARYASFVNYVLAVQATRIADFIYGAE